MVDYGRILAGLVDAGVDFLLVGGLAVGANGYVRATKDVDVLVPSDPDNTRRVLELLASWGATRVNGQPFPEEWADGLHHIRALTPFGVLDLIPEGETPLDLASLRSAALRAVVDGTEVPVVGLAGLVTLKRLANRLQDRLDLEKLETVHGELPDSLVDIDQLR